MRWIRDRLAVHAGDDVARPQAARVRLRGATHLDDERTARVWRPDFARVGRRDGLDADAFDRAAAHLAVLHQRVDHRVRQVARDCEADALIAAALAEDAGI